MFGPSGQCMLLQSYRSRKLCFGVLDMKAASVRLVVLTEATHTIKHRFI